MDGLCPARAMSPLFSMAGGLAEAVTLGVFGRRVATHAKATDPADPGVRQPVPG